MKNIISSLCFLLLTVYSASCQNKPSQIERALASLHLQRDDITLCGDKQLGDVHFLHSCGADTRKIFDLGVSLLHSFEYDEAEKAFVQVLDTDPQCVMAYWGIAMSNFHSLWLQSGNDYLEKGARVLSIAHSLPKSERETDYLDAVGTFYNDWQTTDHKTRVLRYEKKMEELYKKYPDDIEATIFYALALTASADPADKSYANQRKSGKLLESLYPAQPNHPGITHYIIHNYDQPALAEMALPVARRYAQIAPASAHAQHMPSHIFTRLGLWEESIHSNIHSTSSALCYSQHLDPESHWDEELHGMDYLVYAYLQIGDTKKANEQYEYLKTFKKVFPANFKIAYTAAAVPSRIALENRNWVEAATLQLPPVEIDWDMFPWQKSILHFARALGSVRSGDIGSAQKELAVFQVNHQKLLDKNEEYAANQVQIQMNIIEAWIHFAKGHKNEAIAVMKKAATMEYNTAKHPVTPGEMLPAGELLGDLLMAINKPREALKTYEYDLQQHPNRFNGLYGAAVAANAAGDQRKATKYFEMLLTQAQSPGSVRPELNEARTFLTLSRN